MILLVSLAVAAYRYNGLFEEARLCGMARPRIRRDNS
jgi:hypothetical protein